MTDALDADRPDPHHPDPDRPDAPDLVRPQPLAPWSERLRALRLRWGLDARAAAWAAAALVGVAVTAWLLRPAPTPLEESLPVASTAGNARPGAPSGSADTGAATDAADGSESPAPTDGGTADTSLLAEVVAHAAGAVVRPGVYRLPPGARVDDLVQAAGGLTPDADEARLNLAAVLADGDRVYVPRRGEGDPPPVAGPDGAGPSGGPGEGAGGGGEEGDPLIDINTADEAELEDLPGVGPSIAAAIVAHRDENGPFTSVDDLLDVRGIGEATLEEIRPRATV